MLDVMYDIPSDDSIKNFTITKEMVEAKEEKQDTKSSEAELIQLPKKEQSESA